MGDGSQRIRTAPGSRGMLARPLDAAVFLLPLILFYEITSAASRDRVLAFDLLRRFIEIFGQLGMWAPGLLVIVILLASHLSSGASWSIRWNSVAWMYGESVILAIPLLLLNWTIPLSAAPSRANDLLEGLAVGVGAGVYEELVFRLILISLMLMIGHDLLRIKEATAAIGAIVLSSIAFAAYHHQPFGMERFDATRFVFRATSGAYLAILFWYRGYGTAAGCHAAYNVALTVLGQIA